MSYWFPHQTGGGVLRADRLVFPIPPGTHWSDVLPIVLPETAEGHHRGAREARRRDGGRSGGDEPRV